MDAREARYRPDIDRAYAHLRAGQQPGPDPIAAMRRFVDVYGDVEARSAEPDVSAQRVQVNGLAAEWLEPADRVSSGRILYLHGGGCGWRGDGDAPADRREARPAHRRPRAPARLSPGA